ncbi:MAG: 50S ribosomal protein L15 [Gammaproteobacteria bacterium]|nr:50S ribosomal protein L15 [Gammaproteobacteria bacterium]
MRLNTLKPAVGSKKEHMRVGRGIGCGKGKTCGRGHKGQKARSGYSRKSGFEGGQLPLQRRLPKFGFTSLSAKETAAIGLHELNKVSAEKVDLKSLKVANVVRSDIKRVRVFLSGAINKAITTKGLKVTKGARQAIEAAGGKIEE